MRLIRVLAVLSACLLVVGCGFRALTERDVVGTYVADADWGRSTLVLHPDHTFDQRVVRNDHTQTSIRGTWRLSLIAGREKAPYGVLLLKPFLAVEHDQMGDPVGGAAPGISRGLLWGITIAADPDYGISFDKK